MMSCTLFCNSLHDLSDHPKPRSDWMDLEAAAEFETFIRMFVVGWPMREAWCTRAPVLANCVQ
jgi:hypothetical protein